MTSTYTLKNVKTWNGTDGGGFEASLYRDGKKVGTVFNAGCGGCNEYSFDDLAARPTLFAELEELGRIASPEFAEFEPADSFIDYLLDIRELNRLSKKAIICKPSAESDETYSIKIATDRAAALRFILSKFPSPQVWDATSEAWVAA